MIPSVLFSFRRALLFAGLALIPLNLASQVAPAGYGGPLGPPSSKWDIFGGYSYLNPWGTIPSPGAGGPLPGQPGSYYVPIDWGSIFSVSRFFRNGLGLEAVGDEHAQAEKALPGSNNSSIGSGNDFAGFSGGVIYRSSFHRFVSYAHVLYGGERVGAVFQPDRWGTTFTAGMAIDYRLTGRWSIRLVQSDYQYIHLKTNDVNAIRLSAGAVFHLGSLR
jgi:hypothetical protein